MAKAKMTAEAAQRIQSATDRNQSADQGFKARAQKAAAENQK